MPMIQPGGARQAPRQGLWVNLPTPTPVQQPRTQAHAASPSRAQQQQPILPPPRRVWAPPPVVLMPHDTRGDPQDPDWGYMLADQYRRCGHVERFSTGVWNPPADPVAAEKVRPAEHVLLADTHAAGEHFYGQPTKEAAGEYQRLAARALPVLSGLGQRAWVNGSKEHAFLARLTAHMDQYRLDHMPAAQVSMLRTIHENPDDHAARLVYADWIQEHGHPLADKAAEAIRTQTRMAQAMDAGGKLPSRLVRRWRQGRILPPDHPDHGPESWSVEEANEAQRRFGLWLTGNPVSRANQRRRTNRQRAYRLEANPRLVDARRQRAAEAEYRRLSDVQAARAALPRPPEQMRRPGRPVRYMLSDIGPLHAALTEDPADESRWGILADALEEQGKAATAHWFRQLASAPRRQMYLPGGRQLQYPHADPAGGGGLGETQYEDAVHGHVLGVPMTVTPHTGYGPRGALRDTYHVQVHSHQGVANLAGIASGHTSRAHAARLLAEMRGVNPDHEGRRAAWADFLARNVKARGHNFLGGPFANRLRRLTLRMGTNPVAGMSQGDREFNRARMRAAGQAPPPEVDPLRGVGPLTRRFLQGRPRGRTGGLRHEGPDPLRRPGSPVRFSRQDIAGLHLGLSSMPGPHGGGPGDLGAWGMLHDAMLDEGKGGAAELMRKVASPTRWHEYTLRSHTPDTPLDRPAGRVLARTPYHDPANVDDWGRLDTHEDGDAEVTVAGVPMAVTRMVPHVWSLDVRDGMDVPRPDPSRPPFYVASVLKHPQGNALGGRRIGAAVIGPEHVGRLLDEAEHFEGQVPWWDDVEATRTARLPVSMSRPGVPVRFAAAYNALGNRPRKNRRWWYDDQWFEPHQQHPPQAGGVAFSRRRARMPFAMPAAAAGHDPRVKSVVADYVARNAHRYGLAPYRDTPRRPVDPALSRRTADAFHAMPHAPDDPEVRRAYRQLMVEIKDQFDHIAAHGVRMEPWLAPGQPYKNSSDMFADVRGNRHLWFFPTINPNEAASFGKPGSDLDPAVNPLVEKSGHVVNGHPLTYNDLLRAVHDYAAHASVGNTFGPVGEYNAWAEHAKMFSPLAVRALTTETHGQNSWVNFGPHLRRPDGSVPNPGEPDYVPQEKRPFADQKVNLLPPDAVPPHPYPEVQARHAEQFGLWRAPAGGMVTRGIYQPGGRYQPPEAGGERPGFGRARAILARWRARRRRRAAAGPGPGQQPAAPAGVPAG